MEVEQPLSVPTVDGATEGGTEDVDWERDGAVGVSGSGGADGNVIPADGADGNVTSTDGADGSTASIGGADGSAASFDGANSPKGTPAVVVDISVRKEERESCRIFSSISRVIMFFCRFTTIVFKLWIEQRICSGDATVSEFSLSRGTRDRSSLSQLNGFCFG